jgi:glutamyl-tRNA synthetase
MGAKASTPNDDAAAPPPRAAAAANAAVAATTNATKKEATAKNSSSSSSSSKISVAAAKKNTDDEEVKKKASSAVAPTAAAALSKEQETLVKQFLSEAEEIAIASRNNDAKTCEKQLKSIDAFLQTRTYFVTDAAQTTADVAMCKALNGVKSGVEKFPEIKRFVELMTQTNEAGVLAPASSSDADAVEALGKQVGKMAVGEGGETGKISKGQAKKDAAKAAKKAAKEANKNNGGGGGSGGKKPTSGSFEIDLKDAEDGKVCTRFPPEPSGYLHIGHAKAALLNHYFARRYKGTLILRFDDTNPDKEKQDFVDNILKDCATLGLDYDKLTYTSDSFPQILKLGDKMMKEGKLYVDTTPVDKMREERMSKTDSACRTQSVEENMKLWEEMKKGSEVGVDCCVRIKIDMQSDNGCMRDPVCFRCNIETPHHRTGDKYKVYPTYDFACPFVDAIEGVTHALRTSEYKDREEQYQFIQKAQGQREVNLWDYSRMNFTYTTLSKRKLQWFVDNKHAEGWTDPRFPTVQGVVRRGMRIEALKEFILSQGASKNMNTMEWDKIWAVNKKLIAPETPMHVAVKDEGRVKVIFDNCDDGDKWVTKPKNPKNKELGVNVVLRKKEVWVEQEEALKLKEGEEATFTMWGNAIPKKIHMAKDGKTIETIDATLNPDGDVKSTKVKVNWLPAYDELVELELHDFGYLITKKQPEDGDDFKDLVNLDSDKVTRCHGDCNLRTYQLGQVVELKNKGFYIIDKIGVEDSTPYVLFNVPGTGGKVA